MSMGQNKGLMGHDISLKRPIERALVSVFNKEGLEPVLRALHAKSVEIISTGGTLRYIEELGIPVQAVESITHSPEILGGRVKTLHPAIFGGILARRDDASDAAQLHEQGYNTIDVVIVDLYPFEETLAMSNDETELIEKIDIGGVSLLRAAAKNYRGVLVIPGREHYPFLLEVLNEHGAQTTLQERHTMAAHSFSRTAAYDACVANRFLNHHVEIAGETNDDMPQAQWPAFFFSPLSSSLTPLRYGENPHQEAAFWGALDGFARQLHGRQPSYNNILDLDGGVGIIDEYQERPTVAIIKHGTPCGLASAERIDRAWDLALAGDPQAAFGGVIVLNRTVDDEVASRMDAIFFEVCLAPEFTEGALETLSRRKNRILLQRVNPTAKLPHVRVRTALDGVLLQTRDDKTHPESLGELATSAATPSTYQQQVDLAFANKAVKHCHSNAIVLVKNEQLIGVGAGHTSRVDAVEHAILKARQQGHDPKGAVLASDAFFPFADSVRAAAKAGVVAIVQPGGSIRDEESIVAARELGISMYITGLRHFKH